MSHFFRYFFRVYYIHDFHVGITLVFWEGSASVNEHMASACSELDQSIYHNDSSGSSWFPPHVKCSSVAAKFQLTMGALPVWAASCC